MTPQTITLLVNKTDALTFLRAQQPLPDDDQLTQDLIDAYDAARRLFLAAPDHAALPLFLRSFGKGDGWGVYPLVEDLFHACSRGEAIVAIREALEDPLLSDRSRYWVTQLAAAFADPTMRTGLALSLRSESADTREAAQVALERVDDQDAH
ncbi:hypothetical protein [Xanthomonas sacchari]|uniref:Uncharacterized protein n=1 Tax=Xanthomonas sacchari TaxID=56458 RepID=A0AA46Q062_9XANT|nr:hypothetical protein [Xanthomonas sacchari]UYK87519.1 hypothetical protein NG824_13565 [Xanthomonas sacchari]